MKKFKVAALASMALVCLPLALHGQPIPDVGRPIGVVLDAGGAHDGQVVLAAVLGLVAWALRRFVAPTHLFHTDTGAIVIAGACTTIGALVPVLEAHAVTIAALVGAVTSGVTAALALSNPTLAARDSARPLELLVILLGVGLVSTVTGCACYSETSPTYSAPSCVATRQAAAAEARCALENLPKEVSNLVPAIIETVEGQQTNWEAQLSSLEARSGAVALCAEQAALGQLVDLLPTENLAAQGNPGKVEKVSNAIAHLAQHTRKMKVLLHPLVVPKMRAHRVTRRLLDVRHDS